MMARCGYQIADVTNRLMKKAGMAILPRNRELYSVAAGLICEFYERAVRAEKELERLKRNPAKTGRWLVAPHPLNKQCNQCGKFALMLGKSLLPNCPHCGASMDTKTIYTTHADEDKQYSGLVTED